MVVRECCYIGWLLYLGRPADLKPKLRANIRILIALVALPLTVVAGFPLLEGEIELGSIGLVFFLMIAWYVVATGHYPALQFNRSRD